jgi:hypothetical protein
MEDILDSVEIVPIVVEVGWSGDTERLHDYGAPSAEPRRRV